jgi:uncharacterized protein (TIGR02679 family)
MIPRAGPARPEASPAAEARARFDRPDLAPLWHALRARSERDPGPVTRITVRLERAEERSALADLLGLAQLPGTTAKIRVDHLDRALLDSPVRLDARGVVEAIGGPIVDKAAERTARHRAREDLWTWLAIHPTVAAQPALDAWVSYVRRNGVIDGSVQATRALLEEAVSVLDALPFDGRGLSSLAEDVCGNSHALDDDRRRSVYVLRALACLRDAPPAETAAQRRQLWEQVGVACDALSTTALTAGLRPLGDSPLATTLRAWSDAGQAAHVLLAQLREFPLEGVDHPIIWTVENPAVVAAALRRFGRHCPAIVCASGWPNTAVVELLRQLRQAGAQVLYHGDLDGDGLRIASYLIDRTGAAPWRMTTADYLSAVDGARTPARRVPDVPWDPMLGEAIRRTGRTVSEERVIDLLLDDMASAVRAG